MRQRECGSVCAGPCAYEPITKEEKIALLEEREEMFVKKLEYLRKAKESLKSDKTAKESK